jgi:hypothetical protein
MSSIYPLVSWQVTVPTFTITVQYGTTEVLTVTGGTYWGWLTTGAEAFSGLRTAAAGSLAAVMAATLLTHTNISTTNGQYGQQTTDPLYAMSLVQAGSGGIGWAVVWGSSISPNPGPFATITATSDVAALALFGLKVNDTLAQADVGNFATLINRRTAGVWRPKFAPPAQLEPVQVAVGSGAMSEYSAATQDRLLFGGRLIWSVVWEYVEAADISRQLLTVADYLPTALRATGDTAGTLDDLLWALANGVIVKLALPPIGTAAVDFRDAVMDVSGSIDRNTYATESATAARRYNVTMAFVQTQDWDPGTPL